MIKKRRARRPSARSILTGDQTLEMGGPSRRLPMPAIAPGRYRVGTVRTPDVIEVTREMAEVLLFHHAQGLTPGVQVFADELRADGHTVHVPDLFDGLTFGTVEDGVAHASQLGFDTVLARGVAAADNYGPALVYAGFSLGVMPAQKLAQTRQGATGALLLHSCLPVTEFGARWPEGLPVQVHGMAEDPFFAGEGDVDAARALVASTPDAELFLYPGNEHLFADSSLPSYVPVAAALLLVRVREFLHSVS